MGTGWAADRARPSATAASGGCTGQDAPSRTPPAAPATQPGAQRPVSHHPSHRGPCRSPSPRRQRGPGDCADPVPLGQGWARPVRTWGCPARAAVGSPQTTRALAPPCRAGTPSLGALPAAGLQPPVPTASSGRVLLLEGQGGGSTAGPVPPLRASQRAEGPSRAAHSGAETRRAAFRHVVPFNGAKAENPPQVPPASVPSHLTQLFALLQFLLQLQRPAKEGAQKRFCFS